MQEACTEIRSVISEVTAGAGAETISLSGGLDSSILATLVGKNTNAYVMVARDFPSSDLVYAQMAANQNGLEMKMLSASTEEILEAIDDTVKILHVFNPIEIRNSIVIYLTMQGAKKDGFESMMTGDGADELFAGYAFFQKMSPEELKKDLERIWGVMHFPSRLISSSMGLKLHTPFLDKRVVEIAMSIPVELKVREEGGKKYGKWILRKAFENQLPRSIAWRDKAAMQDGSGTNGLSRFFNSVIQDSDFTAKAQKYEKNEHVKLQTKEALFYYEVYRKYYDYPSMLSDSETRCPNCSYSIEKGSHFCRMCGSYPI